MKLVTFSHKGKASRVGMIDGEKIIAVPWRGNMFSLIQSGITPDRTSERFPMDECELKASFIPGKIICVGRNYADHAKELGNKVPEKPLLFSKFSSSVIASGEPITWKASAAQQVDYEGELAVIIGKRAKDVSEDDALNYVFGYTVANDVSARDLQESEPQWIRAKGMDTFCPLGSVIVTHHDIEDPQNLNIKTTLNGDVMQEGNTSNMMFPVAKLISYITQSITLEAGDVVLTGTPPGVGKGQNPPRFLKDGDEISVEIEGIDKITNPCKVIADA